MDEFTFMRHGPGEDDKPVLIDSGSPPYPAPWPIKIYEIGDPNLVGVQYPDGRQVHSRKWWAAKLPAKPARVELKPQRVQLKVREG